MRPLTAFQQLPSTTPAGIRFPIQFFQFDFSDFLYGRIVVGYRCARPCRCVRVDHRLAPQIDERPNSPRDADRKSVTGTAVCYFPGPLAPIRSIGFNQFYTAGDLITLTLTEVQC